MSSSQWRRCVRSHLGSSRCCVGSRSSVGWSRGRAACCWRLGTMISSDTADSQMGWRIAPRGHRQVEERTASEHCYSVPMIARCRMPCTSARTTSSDAQKMCWQGSGRHCFLFYTFSPGNGDVASCCRAWSCSHSPPPAGQRPSARSQWSWSTVDWSESEDSHHHRRSTD